MKKFDEKSNVFDMDEEFIQNLVSLLTKGSYENRCNRRKLTGEWIVFRNFNNKNYYLTMAFHNESNETIFEKVKLACFMNQWDFLLN